MTDWKRTYSIFRLVGRRSPAGTLVDYSKHIQKAEEATRRRNYDFAVQLYQQLLEIDPDVGEARAGLRRALVKRSEQRKGGKLLKALKGAGPLAAAKGLAKAGKHAAAAKQLEQYLASNPLDEGANLLLGVCLENAGYNQSALAVFEFLAEIAPRNPEGLKRAGAMMRLKGDVPKALEYYERALESDPRDRDALKARKDLSAEVALSKSRYDEVDHSRDQIRDQEEAIRLERAQRMHRSPEELREELTGLEGRFAERSSDVDLMLEMAAIHERLRDPEAALDLARRAQTYRKDSPDLDQRVTQLEQKALKKAIARADKTGDQEEADRLEERLRETEVGDLMRRLELAPGDSALRLSLGRTYLRQGRLDEATGELQRAVGDPRIENEARVYLAQCFKEKGFLDLARKEYEKALAARTTVDERAREILYNLGAIAEAEGDVAEARSCYARIYEVDIGYRDVAAKMEQLKNP